MNTLAGEKLEHLYYNNKAIYNSKIEVSLKNEINNCIKNKDDILICYPNPKYIIPLIIEAVLKNEIENFKYNEDPAKRTTVLIVSKNKELISVLKDICISSDYVFEICKIQHKYLIDNEVFCNIDNPYYARLYWRYILSKYYENEIPDKIPLHYVFPISYGYHTFNQLSRGNMNKVGRKDNSQNSVFLVTANSNIINSNQVNYDYIFIDYTTLDKNVHDLPKGTLGFFNKPLDERISFFNRKDNVKNYILGYEVLEQYNSSEKPIDSPFFISNSEMISSTKFLNINIEYIKADFEYELENAFHLLKKLIYKRFDSYDLNLIRTLFYNIIKLPVEGVIYDSIAKFDPIFETINDLIKELKESDNRYEDGDFEQIIKCLEDIYIKYNLDILCPKYEFLRKIIETERTKQRTVGIITSNKIRSIALKEKLSSTFGVEIENLEELGIRFFNKKKLINEQQSIESDTVVMFSATSVSDFNIFKNLEEVKTHVLLYKIEINELVRKFSRLLDINNTALSFFNPKDKELLNSKNIYRYFFNRLRRHVAIHETSNFDDDLSITKLSDQIFIDKNIPAKRSFKDYTGDNVVSAKLINLEGNGAIFVRKNSKVRFLNKKQKNIIIKRLIDIKSGDKIVLIDNDSRKELFNVFINNTEAVDNESVNNYNIIEEWREKYEDKYVSLKYSDDKLYKKLKELGWDKSTKSILSNWRSGYSLGPRDLKDIELLGKALNIEVFSERAKEFHEAMSSIRVERRVAAKLLNKIIYYSKRAINNEDLEFLSKYNLSLDDVSNAVKVRKVIGVSSKVYKVKPSEVGILFK
ncbi:hypothetical protein AMS60_02580 [Bacillus sp. FJAT-21945]|nr:hypothetical protein AMS60_02580 [Bacillus sp. FJAT-21945]